VIQLAAKFVPAADEVHHLQMGGDPECRLFQKFAEHGHYGGRARASTRQGTYAATPSGVFLASINSNDPERVAAMLRRALAKWETLSQAERLLPTDPRTQTAAVRRAERYYPADGLVLSVTARDLGREVAETETDWRAKAWNQDYAWFTKAEARQFLPAKPEVGQTHGLPAPVVRRIACAHLVDNVRGQTTPFEDDHVKTARLTAEVTAVAGDAISLKLTGETLTTDGGTPGHGLDTRLLGTATYDVAKERFVAFELVAVGTRWGGTRFNFRRGDLDAAPMGVVFTLAGDSPGERVAPAFYYHPVYRPVVPRGN
jgi:hypothetical protein